jgi:flagellar motor switch protein FliN
MTNTTAETLARAAGAACALLPSPEPLTVRPAGPDDSPEGTGEALIASYVGQHSVDIALVVAPAVLAAVGATDATSARDALRPALEAGAEVVGPGVLGDVKATVFSELDGAGDFTWSALVGQDEPQGWVGLRNRQAPEGPASTALNAGGMKVLYDVEMTLTAEIGRTRLLLREVLNLTPGAVLELDRNAGSPADILVNGRLIARGEVVVLDEDYAVRVTEIVSPEGDTAP